MRPWRGLRWPWPRPGGNGAPAARPPRRRVRNYLLLGLGVYLLFLLATLPAAWLAWGVQRGSGGTMQLALTQGTVWRGSGTVAVGPAARAQPLGRVEWRINPAWLLTGRVQIALDSLDKAVAGHATLRAGLGGLQLRDTRIVAPANVAARLYAPAALITPGGELSLTTDYLRLGRDGSIDGGAELRWHDAASSMSPVRPLGDYRVVLSGKGPKADLRLSTEDGALELVGQGVVDIAGSGMLRFNGSAQPRTQADALEPLLQLFGRDMGGGRRTLIMNTRLPGLGKRP